MDSGNGWGGVRHTVEGNVCEGFSVGQRPTAIRYLCLDWYIIVLIY